MDISEGGTERISMETPSTSASLCKACDAIWIWKPTLLLFASFVNISLDTTA